MSDRYDSLSPRDLVITLRSLPRRFDSILAKATKSDETVALIGTPGPGGESLSIIMSDGLRTVSIMSTAAGSFIRSTNPSVPAGALDPEARKGSPLVDGAIGAAVASISEDTMGLADSLDGLSADDWGRSAEVTGGGSISLVDLVRDLVRHIIGSLRRAESQADWMTDNA